MSLIEKIKIRLKNFFKPYIIYKIGDKYAVRATIFAGFENAFVWIEKDGKSYWHSKTYRDLYCLVDTPEEAYKIIEIYKELCKLDKSYLKKKKNKVKYAYECYTNGK